MIRLTRAAALTILLIEDDAQEAVLFGTSLESLTPQVRLIHVQNIAEAFDQLAAWRGHWPPLLVALDLASPGLHSHSALEQLKAQPELRHVPVVVFSNSDRQEDVNMAYHHHANAYLIKPSSFEGFRVQVKTMIHYWQIVTHAHS